ncbi:MAG: CBS domain-containing protein [Candidatus Omnitrophica bacterium]|nr:CBS domain-containing protein [Candidatus Omnitrophota bacterium]MBU3934061.1 CBS domain-containing protein [Candidatus Omnitrophota bacterium]MBU4140941.1 CBS domain-containing protein [Candidatus Omnitrophota bacterium]
MKVKDCMTKEVVTVKRSTTLSQLIKTFQKYNFHTLPVVEADNALVGIINFEDILKVFQPYSEDLSKMLMTVPFLEMEPKEEDFLGADISSEMGILVVVDDIMNTHFVTAEPEIDINKARSLMKLHSIARLPVVEEGKLAGMISLFDIILAVFRERGVIK